MIKPSFIHTNKYIYYKCNNPNKKGVIIFVHGFSSSYMLHYGFYEFNNFNDYDYFAFNFRGHELGQYHNKKVRFGSFKEISDYSIYEYVNELIEQIEKYNFKNIILIGHSMGGGVSLLTYSKIASRIKKIILVSAINPSLYTSSIGLYYLFSVIGNFLPGIKKIQIDPKYLKIDNFSKIIDNYMDYEIDRFLYYKRKYILLGARLLSPNLYIKLNKIYKEITIPVLFIMGECDKIIPAKPTMKYLHSLNNPFISWVVIPGTHHISFIEKFEEYNQKVWNFINDENNK